MSKIHMYVNTVRVIKLIGFICLFFTVPVATVQADWVNWYAALTRLQGNDRCISGERDCNPCATNVIDQFNQILRVDNIDAEPIRSSRSWWLNSDARYQPSNRTPEAVFNIEDYGIGLDIAPTDLFQYHVQGFVRTYSRHYNYVGSHSDDYLGSLFLISHPERRNILTKIISSDTDHPSGLSIIGQHVVYADGQNQLRLLDLDSVNTLPSEYGLPLSDPERKGLSHAGGGVAIAKLQMGGYLLLVTDGDGGGENNASRLYYLGTILDSPGSIIYLGTLETIFPNSTQGFNAREFKKSENLDLITECGTREIYAVHISGSNQFVPNAGNGWWRLSKLEWGLKGPHLRFISLKSMDQDFQDCHLRSAGSVYVTQDNNLLFYCHARNADTRESDFDVISLR